MLIWRYLCAVWMAGLATAAVRGAEPVFRIELVAGPSESATISRFSSAGLTLSGASERTIPVSELVSFQRHVTPDDTPSTKGVVLLSSGGRLVCDPVAADDERLTVNWTPLRPSEPLPIPLEHVQAVILRIPSSAAKRQWLYRNLALESLPDDVAWLDAGDRLTGELVSLTPQEFTFATRRDRMQIRREKLVALRMNPELMTATKPAGVYFLLSFTDGSRMFARQLEIAEGDLRLVTFFGADLKLKRAELAGCQVFHDRLQPVSALTPAQVRETAYLNGNWPWVKNHNVQHGPLRIGDREFGLGLGVHSRSELTYNLERKDREFRATVGIDHAAAGAGSVVFSVLLDDQPVWSSPAVTGRSEAMVIPPVNLRGKRRLTLVVDYGDFGDVSDYANWCDPIILRDP